MSKPTLPQEPRPKSNIIDILRARAAALPKADSHSLLSSAWLNQRPTGTNAGLVHDALLAVGALARKGLLPGKSYEKLFEQAFRGAKSLAEEADALEASYQPIVNGINNPHERRCWIRQSCGSIILDEPYLTIKQLEDAVLATEAGWEHKNPKKLGWKPVNFRYAHDTKKNVTWVDWDMEYTK